MCVLGCAALRRVVSFSIALGSLATTASYGHTQVDRPPSISGTPTADIRANEPFLFQPVARDEDGDRLRFWIVNKPWWARFDSTTGRLSGKPNLVGQWRNIRIFVADDRNATALPPFAIEVRAEAKNSHPEIRGVPPSHAEPGRPYRFVPEARDTDGDPLSFVILNKPSWARFDTRTGSLDGEPTHDGSTSAYKNVLILVSDGQDAAALPPFTITISPSAAQTGDKAIALHWTMNALADALDGYLIHYGTRANTLIHTIHVRNPGLSSYLVEGLEPQTYYFAMRAVSRGGTHSALSNVISVRAQ